MESEQNMSSSNSEQKYVLDVYDDPVMKVAVDVFERLGAVGKITLKAKGRSIPNAVAIANIITEEMMKGISVIENITVDSETPKEMGRMLSTIDITIIKKIQ